MFQKHALVQLLFKFKKEKKKKGGWGREENQTQSAKQKTAAPKL